MHRALGVGAAAHRNVVVRAVRRKNVEPAGVPEPPAPAKTRKTKAVKPAAEVADGQVSAPARKPRGSKKVEAKEEAAPGAMATGSSATAARAKSISASNLPWANAAARPAAAPAVRPRRERREKAAPIAQRLQAELEAVEASITRIGADGSVTYDRAMLGEGRLNTYALSVYPGKEDRFCEFMRYKMLDMPGVFDAETGQVVPRRAEFSIPTKTIKVFSEKSLKWSSKAIGYKQGGWVLVETILDNSMVEQLSKMIYFQDWRHAMSYTLPETTVIAPKPCPPEVLADIEAWKLHKKEELEELAKCREYGGEVDREIFNKVIRRDQMKEDVDVDETGRQIYKKDYTGTYVNPNAFFDGSEDPAANASNRGDANTSRPRFDQRAEGRGGRGNNRTFDGAYGREAADNDRASQDGGRLQQGNAWQQDDAWQQGASWQGEDSWQQDESWGNRRQQLQPRQQRDGERWGNRRGRRGNRNDAEYSQGYLRNDSWGSQQQNLQQGGRQWQGQGGRDQDASGWQDSEFLSQGWEAGAGMEDDFQSDTWGASPSTRGNWRGKQERGVAGGGKRAGAGGDMLSTDMDDGEARDGTHRSWNDGQQRQGDGFDSQAMGDDWVFDDEGSAPLGGVPIQQEQQQQRQQRRGYRGR